MYSREEFILFEKIFDKINIPFFNKCLDGSAARQRAIAENIANVETPNYQTKDIDFEKVLNDKSGENIQLIQSDKRHLDINQGKSKIYYTEDQSRELYSGENNVDIDKEMVKSAENQLYYSANSRIMAAKFRSLHSAIRGEN